MLTSRKPAPKDTCVKTATPVQSCTSRSTTVTLPGVDYCEMCSTNVVVGYIYRNVVLNPKHPLASRKLPYIYVIMSNLKDMFVVFCQVEHMMQMVIIKVMIDQPPHECSKLVAEVCWQSTVVDRRGRWARINLL